jgi:predicted Zn-dependent protease
MPESPRLQQIRAMLADDPNDPFLLYGMGMEYVSLGDDDAAIATFERLAREQPGYVPTYLMLGQALHRQARRGDPPRDRGSPGGRG